MSRSRPPFGVFTTDTSLVVRTWDRFLAEITGIEADRALNRALASVLPDVEQQGLLAIIQQVVANGTVQVLAPALHRSLIPCRPSDRSVTADRMQQRPCIACDVAESLVQLRHRDSHRYMLARTRHALCA